MTTPTRTVTETRPALRPAASSRWRETWSGRSGPPSRRAMRTVTASTTSSGARARGLCSASWPARSTPILTCSRHPSRPSRTATSMNGTRPVLALESSSALTRTRTGWATSQPSRAGTCSYGQPRPGRTGSTTPAESGGRTPTGCRVSRQRTSTRTGTTTSSSALTTAPTTTSSIRWPGCSTDRSSRTGRWTPRMPRCAATPTTAGHRPPTLAMWTGTASRTSSSAACCMRGRSTGAASTRTQRRPWTPSRRSARET